MKRFLLPGIFALILLWLMFFREAPPRAYGQQFYALGTQWTIKIRHNDPGQMAELFSQIRRDLDAFNRRWHAWEGSELAEVNARLAASGEAELPESLRAGVQQAQALAAASNGLFEPAIAPLVQLWGFHESERPADQPPPAPEAVAAALAGVQPLAQMRLEAGLLSAAPGSRLDFGAFAKGLAVAQAVQTLAGAGIEHATVNAGGDLQVIGNFGPRNWRIGVVNPRGDGALAIVDVPDGQAIFTSGDYERFFSWPPGEAGARRYHHILDPRSGYPADGLISVTVLHEDAAHADAAATALVIAGADWPRTAAALGLDKVLVVAADQSVAMTPAMQPRVEIIPNGLTVSVQPLP